MVAAESLAKMGMDRCIMEIAYQPVHQPLSGDTNNYSAADLTKIDGSWSNDFLGPVYFSPPTKGDFINLAAGNPQRISTEPYWIIVTNRNGDIIGRFAYIASGSAADLNAIGNIFAPNDTYVRTNGYIGIATNNTVLGCATNVYTRGICSDVNLVAFLRQLGYANPVDSATRILCYRYGWPAGVGAPTPPPGVWKPGDPGVDDNGDGVIDSPQEYDPVQPKGCVQQDQAIPDLTSLDSGLFIAPDPANSNLLNYATTSSSDPNLTNSYGIARVNINSMTNAADVPTVVNMLNAAQLAPSSIAANPIQTAINIIDFHTTNRYPIVYQSGGKTYVGVKPTPYLNQVLAFATVAVLFDHVDPLSGDTYAKIQLNTFTGAEIWNPYSGSFPDPCHESITNSYLITPTNSLGIAPMSVSVPVALTFTGPVAPGFATRSTSTTNLTAVFDFTTALKPLKVAVSNLVTWSDFYGLAPTNKINAVSGLASNLVTLSFTNVGQTLPVVINFEADDPRMSVLYSQTNDYPAGTLQYSFGTNNFNTSSPNAANGFFTDTGPREGLASFYVKTNNYVSIGEIGYVHRGEPWATIRLQPNGASLPYGEGNILDYIRVNDLTEVRGRIGINADTNSPVFGALGSPLLFALFEGVTNSVGGFIAPAKIQSIIADIGNRRATTGDFTGIGQMCGIPSLATDFGGAAIPATSDADRETLIRDISNLITARSDSGVTEVVAWGQVIKGKAGKYFPGAIVQIRAKYDVDRAGHLVRITKFQYTRQ